MAEEKLIILPKHAKGEDGYRTFSIRIREEMVEQINGIAAQTGYSRNELISRFLTYALERCIIPEQTVEVSADPLVTKS